MPQIDISTQGFVAYTKHCLLLLQSLCSFVYGAVQMRSLLLYLLLCTAAKQQSMVLFLAELVCISVCATLLKNYWSDNDVTL